MFGAPGIPYWFILFFYNLEWLRNRPYASHNHTISPAYLPWRVGPTTSFPFVLTLLLDLSPYSCWYWIRERRLSSPWTDATRSVLRTQVSGFELECESSLCLSNSPVWNPFWHSLFMPLSLAQASCIYPHSLLFLCKPIRQNHTWNGGSPATLNPRMSYSHPLHYCNWSITAEIIIHRSIGIRIIGGRLPSLPWMEVLHHRSS